MARVLVTGGSGFIGTNLVQALLLRGDAVLSTDLRRPLAPEHVPLWRELDVADARKVRRVMEEFAPEIVFHCAARTDLAGATAEDYRVNVSGTQNVADAVALVGGGTRLIALSSMLVCRLGYVPQADDDYCPGTAYGESKAQAERELRARSDPRVSWVIARPTSIWGPWFGTPYRQFFQSIAAGRFRAPRGWSTRRSLGYVGNTVHQLLCLAAAPHEQVAGRTFYVCDYEAARLRDWADAIAAALQVERPPEIGQTLLRAAARAGDCMQALGVAKPPLTSFRLQNMLTDAVFDTCGLEAICGRLPYQAEQGVARTTAWLREQRLI
jgi:nucleoside-diphosphate-sugar epimerase